MNIIEVTDVSYRREESAILTSVNWSVQYGEHWVIMGVNGSGKTTLLNLITGYLWPTKGKISVLGHSFGQVDLRELRKSIGWVSSSLGERFFQAVPSEVALDVVISGKFASMGLYTNVRQADKDEAMLRMEAFSCSHLANKPFRLLSQGEKQRVLLARAWMAKPQLLILDEPCTGLDVYAREQLLTSIDKLAREAEAPTLLYVTHHAEEVLPVFSHVLLLQNGQVRAAGDKNNVLTSSALSEAFGINVSVSWQNSRPWVAVI